MHDTAPEVAEKMREMIRLKSPIERLEMGCSMYATSKYLITCAILRSNPNISETALRRELFLKFYGDDIDLEKQEQIIKHLEKLGLTSEC